MFVLGAGVAFPTVDLSNGALAAVRPTPSGDQTQIIERSGVTGRKVSLPLEYVLSTKNSDLVQARGVATTSPTALGVEAVQQALSRANISIEQVGLIVADTATPYQTCPSEAHRIAGRLGVKTPAYDLVSGAQFLPVYARTLSSWKTERMAEHVVCVSTNLPSQYVRYESDVLAGSILGDAAAALVLSRVHKSSWQIVSSHVETWSGVATPIVVERTISFDGSRVMSKDALTSALLKEFDRVRARAPEAVSNGIFIGPAMYAQDFADFAAGQGIDSKRVVSGVEQTGFSLGSSQVAVLASLWGQVLPGQYVVAMHCENGMSGHVVFKRS